jgi:predicted ATPase
LIWVLVARGCLDQAHKQEAELLGMAPLASRTLAAACASCFSVWASYLRRDADTARERIDPLVSLCNEHGYAHWHAASLVAKGWVLAETGDVSNGIVLLESGLDFYRSIGSETLRYVGVSALAEALTRAAQGRQAIAILDEMLALVAGNGDSWLEAEMLRQKGEALVALGCAGAGEKCFTEAIRVAREQGALLWELRASIGLFRLWRGQSRFNEALELLRPVYDRFREGLQSRDLTIALAMLRSVE